MRVAKIKVSQTAKLELGERTTPYWAGMHFVKVFRGGGDMDGVRVGKKVGLETAVFRPSR